MAQIVLGIQRLLTMKPWSHALRQDWPGSTKQSIIWLACALGVLAGCSKHAAAISTDAAPAPADANAAQAAPESQPAAAAAPQPAVTATNSAPDLHLLNQALMGWVYKNGRRPASFEEFASSAGVQIPPPPAGKKYAFNGRGFIVLVNR